ncbi:hypothetical protein [Phytohalomonas tamaricis]|uniref:hypothetical protein n=1 Tax=Phytohalomonas tamaricis TaxID=2081032 RepID=UPI0021D46ED6|nr:hypothetical protein [Phytohalomonas tamaricis]
MERFDVASAGTWNVSMSRALGHGTFRCRVRESQARRLIVYEALRNGAYYPWDHQPLKVASERYMRNHMDLNILEEAQPFPRGE